jgi:hypothetical protein
MCYELAFTRRYQTRFQGQQNSYIRDTEAVGYTVYRRSKATGHKRTDTNGTWNRSSRAEGTGCRGRYGRIVVGVWTWRWWSFGGVAHAAYVWTLHYTLSTHGFSIASSPHTVSGHHTCALHPHIHANQIVHSLYPQPPPPRKLLEGDLTFVTLSFNNALFFSKTGSHLYASVGSPRSVCFYDRANCLTLYCIRDDPAQHTLTSSAFTNMTGMTVEGCIEFCLREDQIYAGLENGVDCRECTSRGCLQPEVSCDFVTLLFNVMF